MGHSIIRAVLFSLWILPLYSCSTFFDDGDVSSNYSSNESNQSATQHVSSSGEKQVVIDPRSHTWAAYNADGSLARSGMASAGADWCADMNSACRTDVGSFRIRSLGSSSCVSPSFPMPHGGAPMPYCMYFTQDQALHGSPNVVDGNISHGCVRLHVGDAKWLRYNFVQEGTLVTIKPY
jgi:lipoprotein-anchoring transpeptidase ErfK/SrfK